MLRGGPAQPRRALKHARHPMQRILAQPQWRVTPFGYKALNCDDNDLKIVQIILYASGAFETGPVGASRRLLGGQTFQPEREVLLQICCRCSESPNGLAMLAPASRPPLFERVIVTDKAVEAGDSVVERPRRCVVLLRCPVGNRSGHTVPFTAHQSAAESQSAAGVARDRIRWPDPLGPSRPSPSFR